MSLPNGTPSSAARLVPIAPAINAASARQQDGQDAELMPYTCTTCARRKVKCDKTKPCSACKKGRLDCVYQAPLPRKRKRRPVEDIHDRLERYERLLKANNLLTDHDEYDDSPGPQDGTPKSKGLLSPSASAEFPKEQRGGKLVSGPGRTRYIDSNIWKNLGEELHPSSDEEDVDYGPADVSKHMIEPVDPLSVAFLGVSPPAQNTAESHPPYDMALKLWNIYAQNVDPIIKVVHVPTGLEMVKNAAANPASISKVTECLVFSIYHFAIASIDEDECERIFGQPWATLEMRFYQATRNALVSCSFLKTTELAVLQAYVLLLMSMKKRYDPHTFWILSGVAIRLAQRMGLHRDGELMGLKPFDIEMRRRIFWQLLPMDGVASQLSGTGIAISPDSWDTKQPLNVNDKDIWPDMTDAPEEKKAATDMIFCLARTEVGKFHQKLKNVLGSWSRGWDTDEIAPIEIHLNELENIMEEKYIRYCDIAEPIHCLTMAMARSALGATRLRLRLPRSRLQKASPEDRKEMHALSKKILEHGISVHRNANLAPFQWHLRSFFQWDPLIWILNELRHPDPVLDVDLAWKLVSEVFASHSNMLSRRRSLDLAVARLTLKAWEFTQSHRTIPLPEQPFITDLKEFFARREASRQSTNPSPYTTLNQFTPEEPISDLPVQNYLNSDSAAGYMNFSLPEEFNDMDWMFWEQLLPNTNSFVQT